MKKEFSLGIFRDINRYFSLNSRLLIIPLTILTILLILSSDNASANVPRVTNVYTLDNNENGKIDKIVVTFSEAVTDNGVYAVGADSNPGLAVDGYDIISVSGISTDTLYYNLTENSEVDTSVTPGVTFFPSRFKDYLTNLSTLNSSALPSNAADSVPPVISSFRYKDTDANGKIDTLTLFFSESLDNSSFLSLNDLRFSSNGNIIGASFGNSLSNIVYGGVTNVDITLLTESNITATHIENVSITTQNNFSLVDGRGNTNDALKEQSQAAFIDEASPVFVSASATASNRIMLNFSENLDNETFNFGASGDWRATGIVSLNAFVNGSIVELEVEDINNTAFNATDFEYSSNYAVIKDSADNEVSSFSGKNISDRQGPKIIRIETGDYQSYGYIDNVKIIFSETLDFQTFTDDYPSGFSVNGYDVVEVCTIPDCSDNTVLDSENNNTVYLSMLENDFPDTGATPLLSYIKGNIADDKGNLMESVNNITSVDMAGPTIISAKTKNSTTITVAFSERINLSQLLISDFVISKDVLSNIGNKTMLSVENLGFKDTADIIIYGAIQNFVNGTNLLELANVGVIEDAYLNGNLEQTDIVNIYDGILHAPQNITMLTNNTNQSRAKIGEVISFIMITDEDINTPNITVYGKNISVLQGIDLKHWSTNYTLSQNDSDGEVNFTVNYTDIALNFITQIASDSSGKKVVFDKTPPVLNAVSIFSNSTNKSYGKTGDEVTLYFNASEDLLNLPDVRINEKNITPELINGTTHNYVCKYNLTSLDNEGVLNFTIDFADTSGNIGQSVNSTTNSGFVVFDKTPPTINSFNLSADTVYKDDSLNAVCDATDNIDTNVLRNISGLSASSLGTFTAKCTASDDASNSVSAEKNYSVILRPVTTSAKKGSNDRGASTSQETAQNNLETSTTETVKISFSKSNDAITELSLVLLNGEKSADVSVSMLLSKPDSIPSIETDKETIISVYKYLELKHPNLNNSDIKSAAIEFKVEKSWFTANNIKQEEIALYRFSSGAWESLETKIIGEDADNYVFESVSKGMSVFAIAAKQKVNIKIDSQVYNNETLIKTNETVQSDASDKPSLLTGNVIGSLPHIELEKIWYYRFAVLIFLIMIFSSAMRMKNKNDIKVSSNKEIKIESKDNEIINSKNE